MFFYFFPVIIVKSITLYTTLAIKNENYTQWPGWIDYVSELYKYSKSCRRNWREANEPRHGIIHEEYIKSKARFKYALRFINKNEDNLRKEAMAKNLANKKKSQNFGKKYL